MEPGMLNAFALLLLAAAVTWCIYKKIAPRPPKNEKTGLLEPSLTNMDPEALKVLMEKRYLHKRWYRLGVLVCCCLAATVIISGQSRIFSIVFLACAGLCQYGAVRQKTGTVLSQLLQQQGLRPKTSAPD